MSKLDRTFVCRLFGHKFLKEAIVYETRNRELYRITNVHVTDYCVRCGILRDEV